MKTRLVVAGVIEKDGKILLGQKPPGTGPYPDCWHTPGGGVDLEKETLEEALRREVKEETDLEVTKLEQVGFDEDYEPDRHGEKTHYVFLIYKVNPTSMEATPGDDIVKLKWFDKSELKDILLTRPSIKYFKSIGLI